MTTGKKIWIVTLSLTGLFIVICSFFANDYPEVSIFHALRKYSLFGAVLCSSAVIFANVWTQKGKID